MTGVTILQGDVREVLKTLPDESVHCVVTSPPYWGLRDYGCAGQIGLESTPQEYVERMVGVFAEVKRVLRGDGTLWCNMGDCYATGTTAGRGDKGCLGINPGTQLARDAVNRNGNPFGCKAKDLVGMPWRLAFALQADGWYLRLDIIWHKPNPMPESVTDRPTKSHEYIFLLSKSERYHYDADAIKEESTGLSGGRFGAYPEGTLRNDTMRDRPIDDGTRNKRSVWTVATQPFPEAHFATFPEELIKPCILAGCPAGGTVLDPFFGSGTTGLVSQANGCKCIGIELNPAYIEIAAKRLSQEVFQFGESQ